MGSCCGGDDAKAAPERSKAGEMRGAASVPEPDESVPSTGLVHSKRGAGNTKGGCG